MGRDVDIHYVAPDVVFKTQPSGNSLDAFGRLRVSDNLTLFDSQHIFDINPRIWTTINSNGGATTYNSSSNSITLSCTATSGSRAQLISPYLRYQSGKSGYVKMTGNWDGSGTEELSVVTRSNASGSVVNTKITQANFNGDKINGTGASGFNLAFDKANLYFIDFAYLGVGPVRFSVIDSNGSIVTAHTFKNPNNNSQMYMRTATLPFKVEIQNDGTNTYKRWGFFDDNNGLFWELKLPSAVSSSFRFFCCAVESEGGSMIENERGFIYSSGTSTSGVAVGATEVPILSIRPKLTFKSKTNRGILVPSGIDALVTSKDVRFRLILNPNLTGASFVSVNNESIAEADVSSTAFSGGIAVKEFYIVEGGSISLTEGLLDKIKLAVNSAGTSSDILTLTAVRLNQNATAFSSMVWKEVY